MPAGFRLPLFKVTAALTGEQSVTHQSRSPTWLSRRSKHRVWLKDVQLYVFCNPYRQQQMRQNKAGAFEIYFVSDEGEQTRTGRCCVYLFRAETGTANHADTAGSRFRDVFSTTAALQETTGSVEPAIMDEEPGGGQ